MQGNQKERIDLGQTQTFHRRNLSNLINLNSAQNEMALTKSGPPRRTLDQIMNDDDSRDEGEMDSRDSARENDALMQEYVKNLNKNNQEPEIPQDGFYEMVEQPSEEDEEEDVEEQNLSTNQKFPPNGFINTGNSEDYRPSEESVKQRDCKLELSDLTSFPPNSSTNFNSKGISSKQGNINRGWVENKVDQISQATNESCSDQESIGREQVSKQAKAQSNLINNSHLAGEKKTRKVPINFFQNMTDDSNEDQEVGEQEVIEDQIDVSEDEDFQQTYKYPEMKATSTNGSQKIKLKPFKGPQLEIDSGEDEDVPLRMQPPSAPKEKTMLSSQLIKFEEIADNEVSDAQELPSNVTKIGEADVTNWQENPNSVLASDCAQANNHLTSPQENSARQIEELVFLHQSQMQHSSYSNLSAQMSKQDERYHQYLQQKEQYNLRVSKISASRRSESSDERKAKQLKDQLIEAELVRLENLNKKEALRLNEPPTSEGSDQHGIPIHEDYQWTDENLLEPTSTSANAICEAELLLSGPLDKDSLMDSVKEEFQGTRSMVVQATNPLITHNQDQFRLSTGVHNVENPGSIGSFITSDRQSRKLYVITEESQSVRGQNQTKESGKDNKESASRQQINKQTNNQSISRTQTSSGGPQKQQYLSYAEQTGQDLNDINLHTGFNDSLQESYQLKAKHQIRKKGHVSSSVENSLKKVKGNIQNSHIRSQTIIGEQGHKQELQISQRLKETSNQNSLPFELASDEDLLNSNFDRISKILPQTDQLNENNYDFNGSPLPKALVKQLQDQSERIKQLVEEINQLKQVITIKDNTIQYLQDQRPSSVFKQKSVDKAVLALPETTDRSIQTHGPRKQAYYKQIPARVNTNLGRRADSVDGYDSNSKKGRVQIVYANELSSPEKFKSPVRKKASPSQNFDMQKANEETRSLRTQLQSLKTQLNDQEADNVTLIERVTDLHNQLQVKERDFSSIQQCLEDQLEVNEKLEFQIDSMSKRIDSLLADNAELMQLQTHEQINQPSFKCNSVKQEVYVQTEDGLWQQYVLQQNIVENETRSPNSTHRTISVAASTSMQPPNQIATQILDQLQDALSGEQGAAGESEQVAQLLERAQTYEEQQKKIELEIQYYKSLLEDIQPLKAENISTSPILDQSEVQHRQTKFTVKHELCNAETQAEFTEMNRSGQQKFGQIVDLNGTLQMTQSECLNQNANQQMMNHLQNQYHHYKKKCRKLDKKKQKLVLANSEYAKVVIDTQSKLNEAIEKQRNLRYKFQVKLQEKNLKISELKQQIVAQQQTLLIRGENSQQIQLGQLRNLITNEVMHRVHVPLHQTQTFASQYTDYELHGQPQQISNRMSNIGNHGKEGEKQKIVSQSIGVEDEKKEPRTFKSVLSPVSSCSQDTSMFVEPVKVVKTRSNKDQQTKRETNNYPTSEQSLDYLPHLQQDLIRIQNRGQAMESQNLTPSINAYAEGLMNNKHVQSITQEDSFEMDEPTLQQTYNRIVQTKIQPNSIRVHAEQTWKDRDNAIAGYGVLKDQVMPCYKSKFQGKKRVDVPFNKKDLVNNCFANR